MASFEATIRAGADGFETDLRLLADRTAVLFHDDELDDLEIESLSYSHCADRQLSIDRVRDLQQFADRAKMVLEVKRGNWVDALIEEVSDWPDIIVASFDHTLIAALHERGVSFPLGITAFGVIHDVAAYASSLGATWFFPNHRYLDAATVASCRAREISVVPWTANRPREWERLREIGCAGVITDFPEEAVGWRGQFGLTASC